MVYQIEKGVRRVKPYYYDFATTFKERWRNYTVKHLLCKELGQASSVVDKGIASGTIYVTSNTNKNPLKLSPLETEKHLLRDHDIIHNLQHMHEPAIYNDNIPILYSDNDVIVVSKPPALPTHPSGSYRYNSLSHILRDNLQLERLDPCHRLDKATSGVLVLAKTPVGREKFVRSTENRENTEKWYVARVTGEFPENPVTFTGPVFLLNLGGYVNIRNPRNVPATSTTEFIREKFLRSHNESIVRCRPITGKMHQIRIHLRNLGFPIANDYLYNPLPENKAVFLKNELEKEIYTRIPENMDFVDVEAALDDEIRKKLLYLATLRAKNEREVVEICSECQRPLHKDHPEHGIYLHAAQLILDDPLKLNVSAPLPEWAQV